MAFYPRRKRRSLHPRCDGREALNGAKQCLLREGSASAARRANKLEGSIDRLLGRIQQVYATHRRLRKRRHLRWSRVTPDLLQ
ncbi:hypothetical protein BURKHO8Y_580081 [Burkholderia sp. 8Y]|nr:hypothetical protein BURKHO8Y_580081 [Burkholderia sp. 8Y]